MEELLLSTTGLSPTYSKILSNDVFLGGFALLLLGGLLAYLHVLFQIAKDYLEGKFVISAEIKNTDPCYFWVLDWLAAHNLSDSSKKITVLTSWGKSLHQRYRSYNDEEQSKPSLRFVPAPGNHIFVYMNRYIWLQRVVEDAKSTVATHGSTMDKERIFLSCFGNSTSILKEFCIEAMERSLKEEEGTVAIFVPDQYAESWTKALSRPKRPFSSVILDGNTAEDIIKDVTEFVDSKKWYEDRGLPYRRGYLFHGPPGCGKTSFLVALASHLGLNVCCLSLNEGSMSDSALNYLLRQVPPKSAVLIEDVDCVFVERQAVKEKGNPVTFSGLLNAIDGVAAHEGRLLFLTTNHKDKLSPALIRPGRVDMQVYFGLATSFQVRKLWETFYPNQDEKIIEQFVSQVPENKYSMSKLQGFFLNHKDKPLEALAKIDELLNAPLEDPDVGDKKTAAESNKESKETKENDEKEKDEKSGKDVEEEEKKSKDKGKEEEVEKGMTSAKTEGVKEKTGLHNIAAGASALPSIPLEVFAIDSLSSGTQKKRFVVRKLNASVG